MIIALVLASAVARSPPRIAIALSQPPSVRWKHIFTPENNETLHLALRSIEQSSPLVARILSLAAKVPLHTLRGWMPADQAAEAESIASLTSIPLGTLFAINALYDLTASDKSASRACTSILVQATNGSITHGRNLDYILGAPLRNLTRIVDWTSSNSLEGNGGPLFTSVGYLGQVGFNTVVRHGAWALTHDERDVGPATSNWLDLFIRRRTLTFAFIRQLASTARTASRVS